MAEKQWIRIRSLLEIIILVMFLTNVKARKEWETHQTNASNSIQPTEPSSPYKVVCYLSNSEWDSNKINADLCSHVVYIDFAVLNKQSLLIKPKEISLEFRKTITDLKKKGLKVMIAIGGWDDSGSDKYSRLVKDPLSRRRFVSDVTTFLENNEFDGLELQWLFPKCWQRMCVVGPSTDTPGFTNLITDLYKTFNPKGLLLSAYVSSLEYEVMCAYEVPTISKYLDWITVMTHTYNGVWNYWNDITTHVAPLYAKPTDYNTKYTVNFSMNYWIEEGADKSKLLMTIPTFGHAFSLHNSMKNGLGASISGKRNTVAYSKICQDIANKGWTLVRDTESKMGPYAYSGNQWVSFDDALMVKQKSEYIKDMGLGGAAVWSLDFDDYDNVCKCESYPLLKAINRVLRNYAEPDPQCYLDVDNINNGIQ